jgi:DNA-binding transcriptional MocR family regulator
MTVWRPRIEEGDAPLYERLVEALAKDIRNGRLVAGDRLPPHRELAHQLTMAVGTVSRAYAEAERRGLIASHVGRGSFIAGTRPTGRAPESGGPIDMALNLPPLEPARRWLDEGLLRVRRRPDIMDVVGYGPVEGLAAVRYAGADWLRRRHRVSRADVATVIQCNGGQHAMALVFAAAARPGETILCDAATYPGIRTLTDHAGYRLAGVAADARGMEPAALDAAAASTGARAVILIPTLHNPTTVTLDAGRRQEIVAVARARDLVIVEDDAYRVFAAADCPASFADLAPERTFLIAGVSKSLAPGLRLGFIVPPEGGDYRDRVLIGARALGYCPPPLGGLMFAQWLDDGVADRITDEIVAEVRARTDIARAALGSAMAPPGAPQTLHVWLPMPLLEAERVAGRALRAGVMVTPPDAPMMSPAAAGGLRLCLGAVSSQEMLRQALDVVKVALGRDGSGGSRAII